MVDNRPTLDMWAVDLAIGVARRSRDPSTQCGAVILRPDKTVCSVGYNGFPQAMPDHPHLYADREAKLVRIIHAEANAINFSRDASLQGYTMYVSHPPCPECAKQICAHGFGRVVWRGCPGISKRFDVSTSVKLFQECGIHVTALQPGANGGTDG